MRNPLIGLAALGLLVAACTSPNQANESAASPSTGAATAEPSASAQGETTSELVGEWIGIHDCARIVEALRAAGFEEAFVLENVVGNALVPEVTSVDDLADPAEPCADAVPREHGHFFSGDGAFGSTDHNGQQVDDGTYEVVDEDTVRINGTEFDYEISGDTLTLESLAPEGCVTFECGWSIMVAMAGEPLERVVAAGRSQGFEVVVDGLTIIGHRTGTRADGDPAVLLQHGNGGTRGHLADISLLEANGVRFFEDGKFYALIVLDE